MSEPSFPSGWFPDPLERHDFRFFNGRSWTSDVSDGGERYVDPLGTNPSPRASSSDKPNKAATTAVVTGSIGLAIAWVPYVVIAGLVLAILAVVFGVRGLRRSRASGQGRRASIAGIVMGIGGLAASAVGIVLTVIVTQAVIAYVEPGPVETEITSCSIDGRSVDVAGTLTNADDRRHDYTLFVEVDGETETIVLDNVNAGETITWSTIVTTRGLAERCEPKLIVNGPFPFDVVVDPIEN